MATTVKINAKIRWDIWRDRKSGWWVAACDQLNLTASAQNFIDLSREMSVVLQDVLLDLFKHKELESFLSHKGWKVSIVREKSAPDSRVNFDIPPWEMRRVRN